MCMRPFKKCLGGPYRYQLVPCNSGLVALDTLHKCHSARPVIVVVHPWTRAAVTVALLLREVKAWPAYQVQLGMKILETLGGKGGKSGFLKNWNAFWLTVRWNFRRIQSFVAPLRWQLQTLRTWRPAKLLCSTLQRGARAIVIISVVCIINTIANYTIFLFPPTAHSIPGWELTCSTLPLSFARSTTRGIASQNVNLVHRWAVDGWNHQGNGWIFCRWGTPGACV